MKPLSVLFVAALLIAPYCAGTSIAPSTLAGQWSHVRAAGEPPGFFFQFSLAVKDTTLSGTGTYQGEAGPQGTMDVTGYVRGTAVHLSFVFHQTVPAPAPDYPGSFDGTINSASDLTGTITRNGGPPAPEHFSKRG